MNIFEKIYDCNSMTQINHLCEEILEKGAFSNPAIKAISNIYESNDLDERHLICAEWLGLLSEADALRAFLKKKNERKTT